MRKIKMTCDRCDIVELYDNSDDAYDAGCEHQDEHGLEEINDYLDWRQGRTVARPTAPVYVGVVGPCLGNFQRGTYSVGVSSSLSLSINPQSTNLRVFQREIVAAVETSLTV